MVHSIAALEELPALQQFMFVYAFFADVDPDVDTLDAIYLALNCTVLCPPQQEPPMLVNLIQIRPRQICQGLEHWLDGPEFFNHV